MQPVHLGGERPVSSRNPERPYTAFDLSNGKCFLLICELSLLKNKLNAFILRFRAVYFFIKIFLLPSFS